MTDAGTVRELQHEPPTSWRFGPQIEFPEADFPSLTKEKPQLRRQLARQQPHLALPFPIRGYLEGPAQGPPLTVEPIDHHD